MAACRWRRLRVRTFPREGVPARAVWCAVELSVPVFDSWMIEADLLMRWRAGCPCGCERIKPSPGTPSSHRPAKCLQCPAVCSVLPGRALEWDLASVRCHEPRLLLRQTQERGSFDEADAAHVRGGVALSGLWLRKTWPADVIRQRESSIVGWASLERSCASTVMTRARTSWATVFPELRQDSASNPTGLRRPQMGFVRGWGGGWGAVVAWGEG